MISYERKAYYHETDQMGIIHHANYVKWMEESRIHFLDEIGLSYRKLEEAGVISPVAGVSIKYLKPVKFDDVVVIEVTLKKYTGVRVIFEYIIKDKSTGELRATAESDHCFLKGGSIVSMKRENPEFHMIMEKHIASI